MALILHSFDLILNRIFPRQKKVKPFTKNNVVHERKIKERKKNVAKTLVGMLESHCPIKHKNNCLFGFDSFVFEKMN